MSFHNTTKSGSDSTSLSQNQAIRTKVLLLPGATLSPDRPQSSHKRLIEALKTANADVPLAPIMDILYEGIFGLPAYRLRDALNLPGTMPLRRALRDRNPLGYQYLCFGETLAASALLRGYDLQGELPIHEVYKLTLQCAMFFRVQYKNATDWLNIDLVTGEPNVSEDEDEDTPF